MIQFPRKTRIYRGEFQAGPFAAVFLLFLIFFLFQTAFVYQPGLPVQLAELQPPLKPEQTGVLEIGEDGRFLWGRESLNSLVALETRLAAAVQTNRSLKLLTIRAHPDIGNDVIQRAATVARNLQLLVDIPGSRLDLPSADSLALITNATLVVAINLSGEIYFQNQVVSESRLQPQLAAAMKGLNPPPTLVILADKAVEYNVLARVGAAARAAGIRDVLLSVRPTLFQHKTDR